MNITPAELKVRLEAGEKLRVVDVREAEEWDVVRLPGAELIPLSQFQRLAPQRLDEDDAIIVYCHHGMRSQQAQQYLKSKGFTNVTNLLGGIDAWALSVDPAMKRY